MEVVILDGLLPCLIPNVQNKIREEQSPIDLGAIKY